MLPEDVIMAVTGVLEDDPWICSTIPHYQYSIPHSKYTVAEPVPSVLNPIKLQYIDILFNIAEMFQDNPTCTCRMKTEKRAIRRNFTQLFLTHTVIRVGVINDCSILK